MNRNPNFDRDYLGALVQLTRVEIPYTDPVTHEPKITIGVKSINGVSIMEQLDQYRPRC